jgi:hypothetical protein
VDAYNIAIADAQRWGSARVARWAGTLGIVIPAIALVVYPIWSVPKTAASGSEVALWATTYHDRLVVMMLLDTVGVTLWFVFGAAVWAYLRDRLPAGSMLSKCFAAGLIGYATLLLSGFTAFDVLFYRHRGAESSTLLYDLGFGLLAMSGMPTAVALGAFAVAVYAHRVLPRFSAHFAVAAAAAHPLLLVTFIVRGGPLSLEGFSITAIPALLFSWILATALAMPRETQRSRKPVFGHPGTRGKRDHLEGKHDC